MHTMPIPASVRGCWSQGTLTSGNAPLTTRNDCTSRRPNVILETRTLPQSLCSLPPFLFCGSPCPGSLGLSTHIFHSFPLFPAIPTLHHLIVFTLVGSEGGLICCPGSKVPLIGLGGQEKLETQLVFVITNHVGIEKDAIPPLLPLI